MNFFISFPNKVHMLKINENSLRQKLIFFITGNFLYLRKNILLKKYLLKNMKLL